MPRISQTEPVNNNEDLEKKGTQITLIYYYKTKQLVFFEHKMRKENLDSLRLTGHCYFNGNSAYGLPFYNTSPICHGG